jgi:hypothetical protein
LSRGRLGCGNARGFVGRGLSRGLFGSDPGGFDRGGLLGGNACRFGRGGFVCETLRFDRVGSERVERAAVLGRAEVGGRRGGHDLVGRGLLLGNRGGVDHRRADDGKGDADSDGGRRASDNGRELLHE